MVERLLSPGDVVAYSDEGGAMRNALVCRVYPSTPWGTLADLIFVLPPEGPALYPKTLRRSLVRPEGSRAKAPARVTFYKPVTLSI